MADKKIYYVRTPMQPIEPELQTQVYEFEDFEQACEFARSDKMAVTGNAVYDADGNRLFGKYSELVTLILYNAKHMADYIKMHDYTYSDAHVNPAITYRRRLDPTYEGDTSEKKVSCDRLVGWIMYDTGFTDQPETQGLVVYPPAPLTPRNLMVWCEKMGFEKIEKAEDLQAGDISFSRPIHNFAEILDPCPGHTYLHAGDVTGQPGMYYRYDGGCRNRIRAQKEENYGGDYTAYAAFGQPFNEPIPDFMFAYRPNDKMLDKKI